MTKTEEEKSRFTMQAFTYGRNFQKSVKEVRENIKRLEKRLKNDRS